MTGPSSPIATWNHDRGAWETGRTAPCGHAEVYQPAWPKSGSMRGGVVSPRLPSTEPPAPPAGPLLPTATATDAKSSGAAGYPVSDKHRSGTTLTDAVRSMRLLPTPTAHDDGKTPEAHRTMERMGHGRKEITSLAVVAQTLLPTPQAHDGTAGAKTPEQIEAARERGRGRRSTPGGRPGVSNLAEVVQTLLPTPNARDAKGANRRLTTVRPDGRVRGPGDANLSHAIEQLQPVELLPTPVAGEARHGSPNQHRTRGDTMLTGVILGLLPDAQLSDRREQLLKTPTAQGLPWISGLIARLALPHLPVEQRQALLQHLDVLGVHGAHPL